ncbi:DUF2505 domain-containing protein [uncultured Williamsia sp.]|uniref:DUF2505 domain-containing protein n=1 Tax=uncultured Williamsia sp. TaxID=259311 RepID=UPI00262A3F8A|nr:DUF2505 domain-containing protein [uncultured Williamsia sp.]
MPTPVRHVQAYPVSLDRLYATLTDTCYWTDRASEMDAGGGDVIRFSGVGEGEGDDRDRFVAVVRQRIESTSVPRALKRFAPSSVSVICTETWLPRTDAEARGTFHSRAEGLPAEVEATVRLVAVDDTSCTMHFDGTVSSSLAVVGAMVEKMLVGETATGFDTERDFTLGWLRRAARA